MGGRGRDLAVPAALLVGQVLWWPLGPVWLGAAVDFGRLPAMAVVTLVSGVALVYRRHAPEAVVAATAGVTVLGWAVATTAVAGPVAVAVAVFALAGPIWPGAHPGGGTGDPWQRMTPAQRADRDALFSSPRVLLQALLQQVDPAAAHAFVGDDEADELMHRVAVLGKDSTGCPDSAPAGVHGNHQGFYVNQQTVADFARIADPRPALRTVRVPALIIRGDCDFVPPSTAAEYERTLAGSTLVAVAGAGHAVARNQPDRYRDLLTGFLDGVR